MSLDADFYLRSCPSYATAPDVFMQDLVKLVTVKQYGAIERLYEGGGERRWVAFKTFYGTKCQDKSLSFARVGLQRRRPLSVGTSGVACPRSDRECVPDLDVEPTRFRNWHGSGLPGRVTVAPG